MGSLDSFDPGNGPVLPDMPLSVAALAVRLADLFRQAEGLALPWIATADEANQLLALEFGPDEQSVADLAAWAFRFGGVIQSHPCGVLGDHTQHVLADFDFQGIAVTVFAFIIKNSYEDGQS